MHCVLTSDHQPDDDCANKFSRRGARGKPGRGGRGGGDTRASYKEAATSGTAASLSNMQVEAEGYRVQKRTRGA